MFHNNQQCCSKNWKIGFWFTLIFVGLVFLVFWKDWFSGSDGIAVATTKLPKNAYPCVIIGGGVGGLSSAIYLSQLGCKTLVLKGDLPGGALSKTKSVENWPGQFKIEGMALVDNFESHADECGANLIDKSAVSVDFSKWPFLISIPGRNGSLQKISALSCIIATGATPNKLEVPGEADFWGRGVTNCAICDAPMFKDQTVAVVGGGDAAIAEIEILLPIVKKIYLIVRSQALRAKGDRIEKIKENPKIEILYSSKIERILGGEAAVDGIMVKTKDQDAIKIPISGLFLAIGSKPNTKIFKNQIKLRSDGTIELFDDQETSIKGIFAVGDVSDTKYRQAITAAGAGCVAAIQALNFLNKKNIDLKRFSPIKKSLGEELNSEQLDQEKSAENFDDFVLQLNKDSSDESDLGDDDLIQENESAEKLVFEVQSQSDIDEVIGQSNRPYVVDVYASWCVPCQMMHPIFEKLADQFKEKIVFLKVDADKSPELLSGLSIRGVPTFIFFDKSGSIKDRVSGQISQDDFIQYLNNLLAEKDEAK